jgi:hypothetical protein
LRSGSEVNVAGADRILLSFLCRPAHCHVAAKKPAELCTPKGTEPAAGAVLDGKLMSPREGIKGSSMPGREMLLPLTGADELEPPLREETFKGSSDGGPRGEFQAQFSHEILPPPGLGEGEPEPPPLGLRRLPRMPANTRKPEVGHHRALTQLLAEQSLFSPSNKDQREPAICQALGPNVEGCQVVLELCGAGASVVPHHLRRIGPVSLEARPLLVGWRHQSELHQCVVLAGAKEFTRTDHFCIAKVRGEMWLFAASPLRLLRPVVAGGPHDAGASKDEDSQTSCSCTVLAPNEFTALVTGDRIALEVDGADTGATSGQADAHRCMLYWRFTQVLRPTPASAAKAA